MSDTNSPGLDRQVDVRGAPYCAPAVLGEAPSTMLDDVEAHGCASSAATARASRRNARSRTSPTMPMSDDGGRSRGRGCSALYASHTKNPMPDAAREHLDGDDHHPGDAHRQPQAGDDGRQRVRERARGAGRRAGRTGRPGRRCAGRCGTAAAPAAVLITIGHSAVMKITHTAASAASLQHDEPDREPRQRRHRPQQLDTGLNACHARRLAPMTRPSGMPTSAASAKPVNTRCSDVADSCSPMPLSLGPLS